MLLFMHSVGIALVFICILYKCLHVSGGFWAVILTRPVQVRHWVRRDLV